MSYNDDPQEQDYTGTSVRDRDYGGENVLDSNERVGNGESSEAIRAEIERTRSQMSNKIDSIQNKLSPETIKAQAQDTLRSALEDGSNAVMNYWRENQGQIRNSVVGMVKRNPIPAALIGAGVGWALIDSLANRNKASSSGRSAWDDYRYGSKQPYGQQSGAGAQGSSYQSGTSQSNWGSGQYSGVDQYSGFQGEFSSHDPAQSQNWSASQATTQGSSVGEKVSNAVEQVRDSAGQLIDKVTNKAGEWSNQAQQKMQPYSEQMSNVGTQTQQMAHQAIQTNPLATGGMALALGALIGLLLPGTERENAIMGDLRDQVADKTEVMVEDVKQRMQQAVNEAKPQVENLAHKVVDNVKQHAQQVVDEMKPEVQGFANKVVNDVTESSNPSAQGNMSREGTWGSSEESASGISDNPSNTSGSATSEPQTAERSSQSGSGSKSKKQE